MKKLSVPEGHDGAYRVERFTISKQEADWAALRARIGSSERSVAPSAGTYTRLLRESTCLMSDTPAELRDHAGFVRCAAGRVLLIGLGIGLTLQACLDRAEVSSVTVLEIAPEVIRLVVPHYLAQAAPGRFTVIQGDANTYTPPRGSRWKSVWLDIWDGICGDNLQEIQRLRRKFRRYADYVDSWAYSEHLRSGR